MKNNFVKRKYLYIFIIAILLEPAYVSTNIYLLDKIWDICKVFVALYIIVISLSDIKHSFYIYLYVLFTMILLFSTFANKGSIGEWFIENISSLLLCLYVEQCLKKDNVIIESIYNVLTIYAIINFISYILFPKGLYIDVYNSPDCWFLGRDNSVALMLISSMFFSFLYSSYIKRKITLGAISCNLSAYLFMLLTWSATSIVAMTLMILIEIIIWKKNVLIKNMLKKSILLGIIINILLVWVNIIRFFSFLIENILHKSIDLTGRIPLWKHIITLITVKPFLGYGIENSIIKIQRFERAWAGTAHNFFLNYIYQGGLISGILLLFIMFYVSAKFDKYCKNKKSAIFPCFIFILMLMFSVEAYQGNVWFWTIMLLCSYIKTIERNASLNIFN